MDAQVASRDVTRAAGVDVGATLAKLAVRNGDGGLEYRFFHSTDSEPLLEAIRAANLERIGVTGGGAAALCDRLSLDTARVGEFDAWARGAAALLGPDGAPDRYLLVSVGTGTSVMLSDAGRVVRIGGTALGGGTLLGLGRQLLGCGDFTELCALGGKGDRWRVDLSVADVYPGDEIPPLAGELTASAFARLGAGADRPRSEDVAKALLWMVGENVALIAAGLAGAAGVDHIVVGGGTLRGNPVLCEAIHDIVGRFGRTCTFLDDGAYGAALGALLVAESQAPGRSSALSGG